LVIPAEAGSQLNQAFLPAWGGPAAQGVTAFLTFYGFIDIGSQKLK
jgi:hypothetical protein